MIRNYVKVALRSLFKNKIYVLINTLGMGIAMACCMAAYLLIAYNIEFDSYFNEKEVANLVKVRHHQQNSAGESDPTLLCPVVMALQAAQEISGIETYTRFCNESGIFNYQDKAFHENIRFADESFFKLFRLGLASGSYTNFNDQKSVFLSGALAKKYFADKDPVGETLTITINGIKQDAVVGGVFERLPLNISFHIDALMRIENYLSAHAIEPGDWKSKQSVSTLFKLTDINQRHSIGKQLNKYVKLVNEQQTESRSTSFELVPFTTAIINGEVKRSNLRLPIPTVALVIFSSLALIILLIACFNLTNTTLAITGKRVKEIGVRKVVGSGRSQIVAQFLMEMIITVMLAIASGVIIAQIIVPKFALMWQLQYGLHDLNRLNLIIALAALLFVTSLLAGVYPALLNSRVNPITLLKGGKNRSGTTFLTRSLLVIQFSLSVMVLLGGIVFIQNTVYQKNLDFGYDKEKLIVVELQGEHEYEALKNKIAAHTDIESMAGAASHIGPYNSRDTFVKMDTATIETRMFTVGIDYFKTAGIDLVAGRDFVAGQFDYESAVIVDENFVLNNALKNPVDAQLFYQDKPYRIAGVVKNHLSGLKQKENSDHIYMLASPSDYSVMLVRTNRVDEVKSHLEKQWTALFPSQPFIIRSQEEILYEEANESNTNMKQIFFFITVLGCMLSASGIYAMASLNVQRRTKEIGVRKVLGASVGKIVRLLNKEFTILLSIAAVVGGAGGYFMTNALLNSLYKQHIEVSFVTMLLSGLAIVIIGLSATSGTIFKTANANPTQALRSE